MFPWSSSRGSNKGTHSEPSNGRSNHQSKRGYPVDHSLGLRGHYTSSRQPHQGLPSDPPFDTRKQAGVRDSDDQVQITATTSQSQAPSHIEGGQQHDASGNPASYPSEHPQARASPDEGSTMNVYPSMNAADGSVQRAKCRRREPSSRGPLFRKMQSNSPRNIVIFGETGTGKSSLINMLADNEVATVSNLAVGCTFESSPYPITIDGVPYTLWDTAGLNEGDSGSVPAETALRHLSDLVSKLHNGLSLLVYCVRGARYRDIIKVNYDLFKEIICQGEVPLVIVVTGLENEECMEDWWRTNESEFSGRKMNFNGHACVTTTKGKKNMFEEEYEESKVVLRDLIKKECPREAWVVSSDAWLRRITARIEEYYDDYNGYSTSPAHGFSGQLPAPNSFKAFFGMLLTFTGRLLQG